MSPDLKRDWEAASPEWEEYVPECSRREIFQIFGGKIWFPGNGIRERRPLVASLF